MIQICINQAEIKVAVMLRVKIHLFRRSFERNIHGFSSIKPIFGIAGLLFLRLHKG